MNTICGRTIHPSDAALISARRFEQVREADKALAEASGRTLRFLQDFIAGKDWSK